MKRETLMAYLLTNSGHNFSHNLLLKREWINLK